MTYVYAIETNGVVNDITYFDFNKPQLTQEDSVNVIPFPISNLSTDYMGRQRV